MLNFVNNGDVVLYFRKDGCGPCKKMAPIVEEICNANDVLLVYNEFEFNKEEFANYKVQGIPTVIKLKDGRETGRLVGLHSIPEIDSLIKGD